MTDTQAERLAEKLNSYTGDNWAQDVTGVYGDIDDEATAADGHDSTLMGAAGQITTCRDGSRLTTTGGSWIAVR